MTVADLAPVAKGPNVTPIAQDAPAVSVPVHDGVAPAAVGVAAKSVVFAPLRAGKGIVSAIFEPVLLVRVKV